MAFYSSGRYHHDITAHLQRCCRQAEGDRNALAACGSAPQCPWTKTQHYGLSGACQLRRGRSTTPSSSANDIRLQKRALCSRWTRGVFLAGTILASLGVHDHRRVSLVSFMKSAGCCPTCESAGQTGSPGGRTSHYVQSPGTWRQPRAINTVKAG